MENISQGLEVSQLGLGCMGMSEFYGDASEEQNIATLNRALELGISFWDTSDMYGPYTNEVLLGKLLAEHAMRSYWPPNSVSYGRGRLDGTQQPAGVCAKSLRCIPAATGYQ